MMQQSLCQVMVVVRCLCIPSVYSRKERVNVTQENIWKSSRMNRTYIMFMSHDLLAQAHFFVKIIHCDQACVKMAPPPVPACQTYADRRRECHIVHGKLGEDCLESELEEKRCLSFAYCARPAQEYYGHPMTTVTKVLPKAPCALWAEAFAYRSHEDASVAQAHTQAHQSIQQQHETSRHCREVARELSRCLHEFQ